MEKKENDLEQPLELDIKKFLPTSMVAEMKEKKVPEKRSILITVILSIITLGIYSAIWYVRRIPELNNLETKKKINKRLGAIFLIIHIALIFIVLVLPSTVSTKDMGSFYENPTNEQVYMFFTLCFLLIFDIFFYLLLSFYSRTAMNFAIENKEINRKISWLFTLVFGFVYLQYETNRIIDDDEEKPRIGPWIFFGITMAALILLIIMSLV